MISFLLGLIIGLLVGAGFVYWALRRTLGKQQSELKQTKRTIANLTRAHELQLQETIESLKRNYYRQLEAETAALAQQYATPRVPFTPEPQPNSSPKPVPESTFEPVHQPEQLEHPVTPVASASAVPPAAEASPTPLPPIADPWGDDRVVTHPGPSSTPEPDSTPKKPAPPVGVDEQVAPPVEAVSAAVPPAPTTLVSPHEAIAEWSATGGALSQLLRYLSASDATVRQQVAIALGQRYGGQPIRPGDQLAIATLSALCRDSNPGVRQAAVEALGTVKSAAAIPVLQRALRDTDAGVVRAASLAIAQFKRYPTPLTKVTKSKLSKR